VYIETKLRRSHFKKKNYFVITPRRFTSATLLSEATLVQYYLEPDALCRSATDKCLTPLDSLNFLSMYSDPLVFVDYKRDSVFGLGPWFYVRWWDIFLLSLFIVMISKCTLWTLISFPPLTSLPPFKISLSLLNFIIVVLLVVLLALVRNRMTTSTVIPGSLVLR